MAASSSAACAILRSDSASRAAALEVKSAVQELIHEGLRQRDGVFK